MCIVPFILDVDLFEGDIVLTAKDKEMVDSRDAGDVDGSVNTDKRNAIRNRYSLWWTKIVPYVIDPSTIGTAFSTFSGVHKSLRFPLQTLKNERFVKTSPPLSSSSDLVVFRSD